MSKITKGWLFGLVGMLIFSGSLPATKAAIVGFDPVFLTMARGTIAGILAGFILLVRSQKPPEAADIGSLIIVALCSVLGFPLLTALALRYITSAHSLVFVGVLPLMTAIFAVLRVGERQGLSFWLFSGMGAMCIGIFSMTHDLSMSPLGDLLMLSAVIICGLGYAEGAKLTRRMGGWQVICWALVVALPYMLVMTFSLFPRHIGPVDSASWFGLIYISLFSMLIGFFFWYEGLSLGGVSSVGQLQLLQPFFGIFLAAALLGEPVGWPVIATAIAVMFCVGAAKHAASRPKMRDMGKNGAYITATR